jgi:hypothetical protein
MTEFIAQFITEILLKIPGAFLRWLYFGRKEKFSVFLDKSDGAYNYIVSFGLIIVVVLLILFFS